MTKRWVAFSLIVLISWLAACSPTGEVSRNGRVPQAEQPLQLEIEVRESVTMVTDESLISQADAIFLGRVDMIGQTISTDRVDAHHFMAVTVLQPIVDEVGFGQGGILTMNGRSPLDKTTPRTEAMKPLNAIAHHLQVGDERIFVVHMTKMGQGDEERLVLSPYTPFSQSILDASELENLLRQVAQVRPLFLPSSSVEMGAY